MIFSALVKIFTCQNFFSALGKSRLFIYFLLLFIFRFNKVQCPLLIPVGNVEEVSLLADILGCGIASWSSFGGLL
jgi:hypothetical protein